MVRDELVQCMTSYCLMALEVNLCRLVLRKLRRHRVRPVILARMINDFIAFHRAVRCLWRHHVPSSARWRRCLLSSSRMADDAVGCHHNIGPPVTSTCTNILSSGCWRHGVPSTFPTVSDSISSLDLWRNMFDGRIHEVENWLRYRRLRQIVRHVGPNLCCIMFFFVKSLLMSFIDDVSIIPKD